MCNFKSMTIAKVSLYRRERERERERERGKRERERERERERPLGGTRLKVRKSSSNLSRLSPLSSL